MAFLDFLFGGDDVKLKRHAKKMVNLNAQAEEREMSAHWLAENGSEEAVIALLNRFTVKYEQGMKDAAEKEMVYRLLIDMGVKVVEPTRQWVRGNEQFAQPLRLIEHFEGPDEAVSILIEMLAGEDDPFKPEKKRQILVHLADFRDDRILEAAVPCLTDFDEGVRYAAAAAVLAQEGQADRQRAALVGVLADPEEDSNRMKVKIAEHFNQLGWTLGEHAAAVAQHPPHGWRVEGDRIRPD